MKQIKFLMLAFLAMGAALFAALPATAQDPSYPTFGPQKPPFNVAGTIAIIGGTVIDATGAPARADQTVLIENGKITKIGPTASVAVPDNAQRFDAAGMTVMPGLIASNQHIQLNPLYPAPVADISMEELRARWENNFAEMPRKAWIYLMQGVTTMRQTSGPMNRVLPIKKRIDAGEIPGPRLLLGGALLMSPQHFDWYVKANRSSPEAIEWLRNDFAYYILNDIDKDTDALLGEDINFWKLYLSFEPFDGKNDFTDAQLKRIIDKAHKAGKSVDVHTNFSPEGYKRLLKFDIDSLEHPFHTEFLHDEKVIAEYARKGIIIDTLLRVRVAATEHAMDPHRFDETDYIMSMTPEEHRILMGYRDKMMFNKRNPERRGLPIYQKRTSTTDWFGQGGPSLDDQVKGREIARENMRRFIKAGVKFSMGTDATSFLNFQQDNPCATEMAYMVEMGMSPMDAIIASTRNGAELAGMLDRLGTLEVGKTADVIVVAGNPLETMEAMKRVAVVIKDGIRFK